jgi:hypothetical protein
MKKILLLVILGLILSSMAFGQEVYRWVDEKGIVHFTDDLSLVPEKYRNQVQRKEPLKEPAPTQPTPSQPASPKPKEPPKSKEAESAPEQRDILGRGEEWWRAKANEWNEKFMTAQKNYEITSNERKLKEQELEAAKLKPKSLQRKLQAEIKTLEGKAKDWEKQMMEAKNMLEKVLPKQAEDNRANPDWVKIEKKNGR